MKMPSNSATAGAAVEHLADAAGVVADGEAALHADLAAEVIVIGTGPTMIGPKS